MSSAGLPSKTESKPPSAYGSVLAALLENAAIVGPSEAAVIAAIKADEIKVDQPLPGSHEKRTFFELVYEGGLMNSFVDTHGDAVPKLSGLQLWKWVKLDELETSHIALARLLEVEAIPGKFNGYSFEYFMHRWECLTLLPKFRHKFTTSILGRYFRMSSANLPTPLRGVDSLVTFHQKEVSYLDGVIAEDLCSEKYSLDKLYYIGGSNPGFDYFYREQTTDGACHNASLRSVQRAQIHLFFARSQCACVGRD